MLQCNCVFPPKTKVFKRKTIEILVIIIKLQVINLRISDNVEHIHFKVADVLQNEKK